jgi:hypothetical protein
VDYHHRKDVEKAWKMLYLSSGGRVESSKVHFLLFLHISCLFFRMPIHIANSPEKLQRDFLSRGMGAVSKFHLIDW